MVLTSTLTDTLNLSAYVHHTGGEERLEQKAREQAEKARKELEKLKAEQAKNRNRGRGKL